MADRPIIERISPLWLGIGISGSLLAILLASETALGRWDALLAGGEFDALARVSSGILRDLRLAIVHCLLAGFLPAALLQTMRSGRRTVMTLQGTLDCTHEECETLAASVRLSTRGITILGLAGFALSFATPYLVPPVPEALWSPSSWNPEVTWHRILGPTISVMQWWLGYAILTVSLRMSDIAKKLSHIQLLDPAPLAPFTQLGLSNALLLIGAFSIWSLTILETGFGKVIVIIGSITLILTIFTLVIPVRGVHKRIRQSKGIELAWINDEISKQRDAFQNPDVKRQSGEMADLVAYRSLIDSVPEWPFTTSTYARLALYAFIPVASWSFGAVAEEIVGRVLF